MSQSAIRVTFTLAFLTGLMLGFQNCTLSKFTGQGSDIASSNTSTPTTNGGFDGNNGNGQAGPDLTGGGFDGKAFIHVGQCVGKSAVDTIVLVDKKGATSNFLRLKCIDQPLPYANRIGELDVSGMKVGSIVILADNMVLTEDPDVVYDTVGHATLPSGWPVPTKYKKADIFCTPNIVSNSIPTFSIYSYDGVTYSANINYPNGSGPIPTAMDLSTGIVDPLNLDAFLGVPLQQTAGGSTQGNQNFYSSDLMFAFTAAQNGYRFTDTDATGSYAATNLNCYSQLPGWDVFMSTNNKAPLPNPAGASAKVYDDHGGGSSGKGSGKSSYYGGGQ